MVGSIAPVGRFDYYTEFSVELFWTINNFGCVQSCRLLYHPNPTLLITQKAKAEEAQAENGVKGMS